MAGRIQSDQGTACKDPTCDNTATTHSKLLLYAGKAAPQAASQFRTCIFTILHVCGKCTSIYVQLQIKLYFLQETDIDFTGSLRWPVANIPQKLHVGLTQDSLHYPGQVKMSIQISKFQLMF